MYYMRLLVQFGIGNKTVTDTVNGIGSSYGKWVSNCIKLPLPTSMANRQNKNLLTSNESLLALGDLQSNNFV